MSKPRKSSPSPDLVGVSDTPGREHYPPITADNCADLAFARNLVRQMRDGKGGRIHQRIRMRRASRSAHVWEADQHLYHGTFTTKEQHQRDQYYPRGRPPINSPVPLPSPFDSLCFDEHTDEQPPYPWLDQFLADENAEYTARSRAQRSGWWCDWTPARDRTPTPQPHIA